MLGAGLGACAAVPLTALQKAVKPPFFPPHVQLYESLDVDTKPVLPLLQRSVDGTLANEPPCEEPQVPLVGDGATADGTAVLVGAGDVGDGGCETGEDCTPLN